ncbi:HNH endonuclease [Microbulbifer guangxiensis]|uniref:HNH endonuclease n=1 Tax=Microbulbifer guangxiensis TaxID=2904249 RepID=UPI001F3250EB|nr:HNH endonuclease [Microbulbifer guangxiensis]
MARVLYLDAGGRPIRWINLQRAAYLYAKDQVLWDLGARKTTLHGGYRRCGRRSLLSIAPVIAGRSIDRVGGRLRPALTNQSLFARDQYICLYCGEFFSGTQLTRDHVMPTSRGGADSWENVVAACKSCNNRKGAMTPDEAGMPLLAVPFMPNPYEAIMLQAHQILADQMEYLSTGFSNRRNWRSA